MSSGASSSELDSEYEEIGRPKKKPKLRHERRKVEGTERLSRTPDASIALENFFLDIKLSENASTGFEDTINTLLPEYIKERATVLEVPEYYDQKGQPIRSLTRFETSFLINLIDKSEENPASPLQNMILRQLKLQRERRKLGLAPTRVEHSYDNSSTPLSCNSQLPSKNAEMVLDSLNAIRSTPYQCSFLSRLCGRASTMQKAIVAVDWETNTPWMDLMSDIRAHYGLYHPERVQDVDIKVPIIYTFLQESHLEQVQDLLMRVFWDGINVSDSLNWAPERCTIVCTYKHLVVGCALMSSPEETYITYLAVKAGWENAQIATTMLYHLIMLYPNKDITLHVSANNSAMLLYNRFGFKAEEFVAGFYEDYLHPDSRASKNAFRLRLRR